MAAAQLAMIGAWALLLASGQILFKLSARSAPDLTGRDGLFALATSGWFWLALVIYGAATLLWVLILQRTPLSLAYPFAAIGFLLVPLAGRFLFGETLSPLYPIGLALIIGGLVLISRG